MKIKCIALDLDGTVLDSRGRLSEGNRSAIVRAAAAGLHVVVASGRSLDSLPEEITAIRGIRYAVTSNGAAVYDLRARKCLRQCKLTPDSVDYILRYTGHIEEVCGERVSYETFIGGKPYAAKEYIEDPVRFGAMPRAISYIQNTRTPVDDIRGFIREHREELDCIDIVVGSGELKQKLWSELERSAEDVYITSSVRQLLEIAHRDAGKDAGAEFLLGMLGLNKEELAAFGDADNDIGLLRMAGIGFAVANASPECREAADRIVASNDEDGVARGIGEILEMNCQQ